MKVKVGAVVFLGFTAFWAGGSTLRAQSPSPTTEPSPSPSPGDGVFTEDQAKRGKEVYVKFCTLCHAEALTGIDQAGPLAGARFIENWKRRTVGDLFHRIRTTMPPGNPGTLTSQQTADVIAYVLQFNGLPAGATELPRLAAPLKEIAIKFPAAQ
jgi:mono/diheme cytochrome c family protein